MLRGSNLTNADAVIIDFGLHAVVHVPPPKSSSVSTASSHDRRSSGGGPTAGYSAPTSGGGSGNERTSASASEVEPTWATRSPSPMGMVDEDGGTDEEQRHPLSKFVESREEDAPQLYSRTGKVGSFMYMVSVTKWVSGRGQVGGRREQRRCWVEGAADKVRPGLGKMVWQVQAV